MKNTNTPKTVIPIVEESVVVGKEQVVRGEVTVEKTVETVSEPVAIALQHEAVTVDRVAINEYVDVAPEVRYEGELTIIPVVKEVLVTEKKLMLVEEVHIRKTQQQETHREDVLLRKESVEVRRTE